jgi:uncharacterized low-complexity protein
MTAMKMRFWVGMLAAGSVIACALALMIATLGTATLGASAASEQPEPAQAAQSSVPSKTYEGVITDTHCGAKHSAPLAESAADCTRTCVHSGDRFALVDGDKMYILRGNPAVLKRAAGERVTIIGALTGNTISVLSVVAAAS